MKLKKYFSLSPIHKEFLLLFKDLVYEINKNIPNYLIRVQKIKEFEYLTDNILKIEDEETLGIYKQTYNEIIFKIKNKEYPPFPYLEEAKYDDFVNNSNLEHYFKNKKYFDLSMVNWDKKINEI